MRDKYPRYPNERPNANRSRLWLLDSAPKKIFVSAATNNQHQALQVAMRLMKLGFEVTARWLEFDFNEENSNPRREDGLNVEWGKKDLDDLIAADTLLVLANTPSTSGGYHVELGYFLGSGKNIVVFGERRNVFFWTEAVRFTPNLDAAVEFLQDPNHGSPNDYGVEDAAQTFNAATVETIPSEDIPF